MCIAEMLHNTRLEHRDSPVNKFWQAQICICERLSSDLWQSKHNSVMQAGQLSTASLLGSRLDATSPSRADADAGR